VCRGRISSAMGAAGPDRLDYKRVREFARLIWEREALERERRATTYTGEHGLKVLHGPAASRARPSSPTRRHRPHPTRPIHESTTVRRQPQPSVGGPCPRDNSYLYQALLTYVLPPCQPAVTHWLRGASEKDVGILERMMRSLPNQMQKPSLCMTVCMVIHSYGMTRFISGYWIMRVMVMKAVLLACVWVSGGPTRCVCFSHGASSDSCEEMKPGHIGAHLQYTHTPSTVTIHASRAVYLPLHTLMVNVRSSRAFMGLLLQARSVPEDHVVGGEFTLLPPGTHTLSCLSTGDTVTHSDKLLKRNLSFTWRAPSRPSGDLRFYVFLHPSPPYSITVVYSYFVYGARIRSSVVRDGLRSIQGVGYGSALPTRIMSGLSPEPLNADPSPTSPRPQSSSVTHPPPTEPGVITSNPGPPTLLSTHSGPQAPLRNHMSTPDTHSAIAHVHTSATHTRRTPYNTEIATVSHIQAGQTPPAGTTPTTPLTTHSQSDRTSVLTAHTTHSLQHELLSDLSSTCTHTPTVCPPTMAPTAPTHTPTPSTPRSDRSPALLRSHSDPLLPVNDPDRRSQREGDSTGHNPPQHPREPSGAPDREGAKPDRVPRQIAPELGLLLGLSAALGMAVAVGLRYLQRKHCRKRTAVSLGDCNHDNRGIIHVQECGDLVQ
ncbi:hypothetical protein P4O66_020801, partial [Electrophorus voltai]